MGEIGPLDPVSYTHLDVYKRQLLSSSVFESETSYGSSNIFEGIDIGMCTSQVWIHDGTFGIHKIILLLFML